MLEGMYLPTIESSVKKAMPVLGCLHVGTLLLALNACGRTGDLDARSISAARSKRNSMRPVRRHA